MEVSGQFADCLWENDDTTSLEDLNKLHQEKENTGNSLHNILDTESNVYGVGNILFQYRPWLEFIMEKCLQITKSSLLQAIICMTKAKDNENGCGILKCFPHISNESYDNCTQEDDKYRFLRKLIGELCNMPNCLYHMPIPVRLRSPK